MTAPEKDANWSRVVPRFAPPAAEPGPRADGFTLNWTKALAADTQSPETVQAPEPAGPRHARRRAFLASAVRVVALVRMWVGTALIAAGTAVRGTAVR